MSYRINLNEIPDEGRYYEFSRETAELNNVLNDLIQYNQYKAELFIRPIGSAYELTGSVQTTLPEVCSLCGWELEYKVNRPFKEILLEEDNSYRKSHSVHGNQSVDFLNEGPSVAWYHGNQFEAGEFVHETVALAEPFYPTCDTLECEERQKKNREILARENAAADVVADIGHPGFAALKDLQIEKDKSKK